jgi:hypothetical protein
LQEPSAEVAAQADASKDDVKGRGDQADRKPAGGDIAEQVVPGRNIEGVKCFKDAPGITADVREQGDREREKRPGGVERGAEPRGTVLDGEPV